MLEKATNWETVDWTEGGAVNPQLSPVGCFCRGCVWVCVGGGGVMAAVNYKEFMLLYGILMGGVIPGLRLDVQTRTSPHAVLCPSGSHLFSSCT